MPPIPPSLQMPHSCIPEDGGEDRIRTYEGISQQIYSLPRLTSFGTSPCRTWKTKNPKFEIRNSFSFDIRTSSFVLPVPAALERAMGIESIARVKFCVILHIFATAKCKKMQFQAGLLSRFVTHRPKERPTHGLLSSYRHESINTVRRLSRRIIRIRPDRGHDEIHSRADGAAVRLRIHGIGHGGPE